MTTRIARSIGVSLLAAGTLWLPGCSDSSTPATPPPAPAPPPAPPAPAPPAPEERCGGVFLEVAFLGSDTAAGIASGNLTLDVGDPETALDFVRPYTIQVPDGGANLDVPGLRPTIGVFVSDLAFMPLGAGFRQTMTIEWISELEVRARAPDCEPVSVSCDLAGCSGT